MAEPGKPLKEEEVDEIIEAYAEHESLTDVEEELEYSMHSVQKYVNKALEEGDPRLEHCENWEEPTPDPEDWTGDGPTPSPVDPNAPENIPNYAGMSPGDFIHEFFEDFEVGLKNRWVEIQARRADRRGSLPSKDMLKGDILNMNSGIGQSNNIEADYIADEYWASAQQYIRQTGGQFANQPGGGGPQYGGGGWQPAGPGQGGMNGVGGPQYGGGGGQGQAGGQSEMFQLMMQEMRQMRQELVESRNAPAAGSGGQSLVDQLKQFQQQKQIFEELAGGDEYVERLEQQIQGLQNQIAQSDDPARTPAPQQGESLEEKLLMLAATNPDVSMDDALKVMERMDGSNKPVEVIKAEKEAEIEEMRLEHESDRTERIGGLFETVAERLGEGFAGKLTEGDGAIGGGSAGGDDTADQSATDGERSPAAQATDGGAAAAPDQPTPARPPEQVETRPCDNCGEDMVRGPNSAICTSCEAGIGPCDVCGTPLDIPPIGSAEYVRCGGCPEILEVPEGDDPEIECPECEWTGGREDVRGELVKCDGCNEHRPIQRMDDLQQQSEAVDDFFGEA